MNFDAREEPKGNFPDGIEVLLAARACRLLRIDINEALYTLQHKDVCYLPSVQMRTLPMTPKRKSRRSLGPGNSSGS